jgi:hypothetical protein
MLIEKHKDCVMGEYDHKTATLREQRRAAVDALEDISRGAIITKTT